MCLSVPRGQPDRVRRCRPDSRYESTPHMRRARAECITHRSPCGTYRGVRKGKEHGPTIRLTKLCTHTEPHREQTKKMHKNTQPDGQLLVTPASLPLSLPPGPGWLGATWLGSPRPSPAVSPRRLKISRGRFLASVSQSFAISGVAAASPAPFIGDEERRNVLLGSAFVHDIFQLRRKTSVPHLVKADRRRRRMSFVQVR
jgi:hypothetical protein